MRGALALAALAGLLSGCSATKSGTAAGPPNAAVAALGKPGAVQLDAGEEEQVERISRAAPPALRARLRYALALGDDGKRHLVVYDGEGLDAGGRQPGKQHEYVVFKILNLTGGEHYDPQQNAIIAPIPSPQPQ